MRDVGYFHCRCRRRQNPLEVLHRVAAMASGGMDPSRNGAVITLLAVTGLTHKQAYKDIFVITLIKTAGVRRHRGVLSDGTLLMHGGVAQPMRSAACNCGKAGRSSARRRRFA